MKRGTHRYAAASPTSFPRECSSRMFGTRLGIDGDGLGLRAGTPAMHQRFRRAVRVRPGHPNAQELAVMRTFCGIFLSIISDGCVQRRVPVGLIGFGWHFVRHRGGGRERRCGPTGSLGEPWGGVGNGWCNQRLDAVDWWWPQHGRVRADRRCDGRRTDWGHGEPRTNWGHGEPRTDWGHGEPRTDGGHDELRTDRGHDERRTDRGHGELRTDWGHGELRTDWGHDELRTDGGDDGGRNHWWCKRGPHRRDGGQWRCHRRRVWWGRRHARGRPARTGHVRAERVLAGGYP